MFTTTLYRRLPMAVLAFVSIAGMAQANMITFQLGAGTLNLGPNPFDTVSEAGANVTLNLTTGVPQTANFYPVSFFAGCFNTTSCVNTFTGALTPALIISDSTVVGSVTSTFSQNYSDVSGGSTANHTLTPLLSPSITYTLSNGEKVTITPLAATALVTAPFTTSSTENVQATFLLGSNVPEPTTFLLIGSALLLGLGFKLRRKSIA
jgi:hypothetical protein